MKRVRAIDIAKELGLSKSTVSLALNNKPGVKEETRREILECKEQLEERSGRGTIVHGEGRVIKVIFTKRDTLYIEWGGVLDFPGKVMAAFDAEAKKDGFLLGISYISLNKKGAEQIIDECMQPDVAGVVILGTELRPEDREYFDGITKPVIIYDSDLESSRYHSVVPDNRRGVLSATVADIGTYIYLKKGVHVEGSLFSCSSIGIKVGSGVGGAIVGWVLALSGFNGALEVQPDSAIFGMKLLFAVLPILVYGITLLCFSKLNMEKAIREVKEG